MAGKYSTGIPQAGLCKNIDADIMDGRMLPLPPTSNQVSLHWENVVHILSHTGYDRTGHSTGVDNWGREHQRSEKQGSQTNRVREECGSPGVWRYVGRQQASYTRLGMGRAESIQKTDILGQKRIQQKGAANS